MMFALYNTNMLNTIFIVLAHRNNILRVDLSVHPDTFSLFQANQSFLLLPKIAYLAKKQQIPNSWWGLTRPGLERTIDHSKSNTN